MLDAPNPNSFPPVAADPTPYPYPLRPRGLIFYALLAVWTLWLVGALALAGLALSGIAQDASAALLVLPGALFGAFAAFQLWRLYKPRVVLYADRVEVRGLGAVRRLSRSNIRGIGRTVYSRNGSYFDIYSTIPGEDPIRLPARAKTDPVAAAWLAGAHDPEAEMLAADRAAVLSDPRFGATEQERGARLGLAKTLSSAFTVAAVVAAILIFVTHDASPPAMAAAVLAPLLGWILVWRMAGLVLWTGARGARPQIGYQATLPAGALGLSAVFANHLYDPWTPMAASAVLGLGSGLIYYGASQKTPDTQRLAILLGIAVGFGSFGLVSGADKAFDTAKTKVFVTEVLDKHVSRGRSTSYLLDVAGWPGRPRGEINVDGALYDQANIGAPLCALSHPGALNLPWFTVSLCQGLPPSPFASRGQPAADDSGFYPNRALRLKVEGQATLECRVTDALTLADCRTLSETPPGYGFGDAAKARLERGAVRLKAMPAGGVFRTRVLFRL